MSRPARSPAAPGSVHLVTLGCARNEVDSEELAARLDRAGWSLADSADADIVLVNTCGFIESAKKDSIDTLLSAADTGRKVVAVGCLAERYGSELAAALPEADAVVGFDSYADIAAVLDDVAAGRTVPAHRPRDRRNLLPVTPVRRPTAAADVAIPGHEWLPTGTARQRLDRSPTAYLKLASGCDRRCSFCAIPRFRGSFVSRPPDDVIAEARWLAAQGARELVLVSENSTSYGKDLGDVRALEALLPRLAAVEGVERVRITYLQPAEMRPSLISTIAATPGVAPYFDMSFQHANADVLRRMRRFGGTDSFLALLDGIRAACPEAGVRSNVIVGFPGERDEDVDELVNFLAAARLDAIGVFAYSDEEDTEAAGLPGKVDEETLAGRLDLVRCVADELMNQRAESRTGETLEVLVESAAEDEPGGWHGRAAHQGPDVDGTTRVVGVESAPGELVRATAVATDGIDLIARVAVGP